MHELDQQERIRRMREGMDAMDEEMRKPFTPWVLVYPVLMAFVTVFGFLILFRLVTRYI